MSGPDLERLRQAITDTQSPCPGEARRNAPEDRRETSVQDPIPNFLPNLIEIVERVCSAANAPQPLNAPTPGLGPMAPQHMRPGMPVWPQRVWPVYPPMVPPAMVPVPARRAATSTKMLLGAGALGLAWLLSRSNREDPE